MAQRGYGLAVVLCSLKFVAARERKERKELASPGSLFLIPVQADLSKRASTLDLET